MRARVIVVVLAVLSVAVALAAPKQRPDIPPRDYVDPRQGVSIPEETGAGVWEGTWVYSCRDFAIALWIRTRDGLPEMKMRYQSHQDPESFETDWDGKASYYLRGQPATFEITYKSRDARRIVGSWHWQLESVESGRIDDAEFSVYRGGVGRSAVFKFERMEQQRRVGSSVRRFPKTPPPVWTFAKVSKRTDVLWEELPI